MAAVSLGELHEKVSHADGDDGQLDGKHDGVPSRLEDASGHLPEVEPVADAGRHEDDGGARESPHVADDDGDEADLDGDDDAAEGEEDVDRVPDAVVVGDALGVGGEDLEELRAHDVHEQGEDADQLYQHQRPRHDHHPGVLGEVVQQVLEGKNQ